MNKKVIYTCITGGYDTLLQPAVVDGSFDYICFTDKAGAAREGVWQIRPVPAEIKDRARLSRYVKILPHEVLQDYEYSLWIDANIRINDGTIYTLFDEKAAQGRDICQVRHPFRDCVYREIIACYEREVISFREALALRKRFRKTGIPRHFGLYENNIILRKHNSPLVVKLDCEWWKEFSEHSKRDQLSLIPVYYRNGFTADLLFDDGRSARDVPFLTCIPHKTSEEAAHNRLHDIAHHRNLSLLRMLYNKDESIVQ